MAEFNDFRPNLVKNEVDIIVTELSVAEDQDPLSSLEGKSDKFRKFVLLRLLSKRILKTSNFINEPEEVQDSESDEDEKIGLARINYIPFVYNLITEELSPHFDNIQSSDKPLDKAIVTDVNNGVKDHRKTLNSGRDAAAYHIGTFLNYVCYEYPDLSRSNLRRILENSYAFSISTFMNINQDHFTELYNAVGGLSVVKEYDDVGKIEILNPDLFSLTDFKQGKEQAIVPDWEKIGNIKVRHIPSPLVQQERYTLAKDFLPSGETIGCPFHDYVRELYPRLIEKIKLMD